MLKAKKANRIVRIPDEKKADYIALGYRITDMDGKVVYDPINNTEDVKELKERLAEQDAEIAKLQDELKTLNEALKAKNLESAAYEAKVKKEITDRAAAAKASAKK